MIVKSTAFQNNGMIPRKYTGFGEDISPELTIADSPEGTVSFAIILDDLDVPWTKVFTHWIIWNIPGTNLIPEGLPKGDVIHKPIEACQGTAWGKHCYRGPKQPFFIRKEHRYVFNVYALDCQLDISEQSDRKILLGAMKGHILEKAQIIGRYKRD